MSTAQIEDLRTKIRKLKYKLQKQQALNLTRKQQVQHINALHHQQLSIQRVFKKISMLLQHKGMTITDWFMSLDYNQKPYIQNHIDMLEQMGVKLQRGQKSLLVNFMTGDLSESITFDQMSKMAVKAGVRMD